MARGANPVKATPGFRSGTPGPSGGSGRPGASRVPGGPPMRAGHGRGCCPGRVALPMRRILVGSFVCLVLGALAARAGTAVRMDVPALVEGADLVVEVRVLATRAVRESNGRIDTEYTLS